MAENEYLDSSKARRWQSVVQAVRVGASIEAVADRVEDCLVKTLRNISRDLPLAEMIKSMDDPDKLMRLCQTVDGGTDVKHFLLLAASTKAGRAEQLDEFIGSALDNCLHDIPFMVAKADGSISISRVRTMLKEVRADLSDQIKRLASKLAADPDKVPSRRSRFCSPPVVCLYSGGLDSAAGLARRLGDGIRAPLIPVVVRHRTDIAKKVTDQIERLGRVFRTDLRPVCAAMSMASPKRIARSEESSQRGRGFLFVSVGGAVAAATDASVVELYESGVGAINVPLLAGMEGSQATRSAHPTFLRKMSQLLSIVADRPIDVTLPYSHLTKGELVCSLNRAELRELAQETVSCVSFPLRHRTRKSCGVCAACLFRRVALHTAGIDEAACMYQIDVLNQPSAASLKLDYLKAFLNQIDSLGETDMGRLPLGVSKHLFQLGVLQQGSSVEGYIDLFRRYRREWLAFVAKAERNGCQWAKLIELPPKAA